jgi:hypothetical protein
VFLRRHLGDKVLGEAGCPSCLTRDQYGVRLGRLGVGEVRKGIGVTPSRGWRMPYVCVREGKTGWRRELLPPPVNRSEAGDIPPAMDSQALCA